MKRNHRHSSIDANDFNPGDRVVIRDGDKETRGRVVKANDREVYVAIQDGQYSYTIAFVPRYVAYDTQKGYDDASCHH